MNEEENANAIDRILSERLREVPVNPNRLREGIHRAIRGIRKRFGGKPEPAPNAPWQWEIIARIRSLPPHIQDPLRRYFVFRESEKSICASIGTTPGEFRRFLRDAAGYILMRQERPPELRQKEDREGTSSGQNSPPSQR